MSINPYQSPLAPQREPPVVGVISGSRADLRDVAKYQKGIIFCILVYPCALFGQLALPAGIRLTVVAVVMLITALAGTVCFFQLAIRVYSVGIGVLLGVLTFIPCVGMIVLLVINGKATSILRQNGVQVGLFGAKSSQI